MSELTVKLGSAGRLVIPAGVRKSLGIKEGATLVLRVRDGRLEIVTRDQAVKEAQALVRQHVPRGSSLTRELIEERRREAARE